MNLNLRWKWASSTGLFPSWERASPDPWAGSQGDILGTVQDQVVQLESWAGHRGGTSASSAAETRSSRCRGAHFPILSCCQPGSCSTKTLEFLHGKVVENNPSRALQRERNPWEEEERMKPKQGAETTEIHTGCTSEFTIPHIPPKRVPSVKWLPGAALYFPMAASRGCPASGSRVWDIPLDRGGPWPHLPPRKSWASPEEEELAQPCCCCTRAYEGAPSPAALAWIFNSSVHPGSSGFQSNSLHRMCNPAFMQRWNPRINSHWAHTTVRKVAVQTERERKGQFL